LKKNFVDRMWSYGVFGRTIKVNNASNLEEAIKLKQDFIMKDIDKLNRILKKFDGEVTIAVASGDKVFSEKQKAIKIYITYSYYTKTSDNLESLISNVSKKLKMNPIIVKDRKDLFPNIIGGQKKIMKQLFDEFKFYKYARLFKEELVYTNNSFKEFLYAYALGNNWV